MHYALEVSVVGTFSRGVFRRAVASEQLHPFLPLKQLSTPAGPWMQSVGKVTGYCLDSCRPMPCGHISLSVVNFRPPGSLQNKYTVGNEGCLPGSKDVGMGNYSRPSSAKVKKIRNFIYTPSIYPALGHADSVVVGSAECSQSFPVDEILEIIKYENLIRRN
jgi:hypothetical protein